MDKRRIRCCVMCAIFENEFSDDLEFSAVFSFADEIANDFSDDDFSRVVKMCRDILENRSEIDKIIAKHINEEWSIERLSKVDLSILRLAFFEIVLLKLPYKICINEAVELAKIYSTEKSPSFINGVLGGYVNSKDN